MENQLKYAEVVRLKVNRFNKFSKIIFVGIILLILLEIRIYLEMLFVILVIVMISLYIYSSIQIYILLRKYYNLYEVVAYMDIDSTVEINRKMNEIANSTQNKEMFENKIKPNISLVMTFDMKLKKVKTLIEESVEKIKSTEITFEAIEVIEGEDIVLILNESNNLVELSNNINDIILNDFKSDKSKENIVSLRPYCTLAVSLNENQLENALEVTRRIKLPMNVRIEKIAIVKFRLKRNDEVEIWETK